MADAELACLRLIPDESTLPPQLHDSVRRHHIHLVALADSLRAAGVDNAVVETSVRQLVESYCEELTAAMQALVQGTPNA